jgi:hypothetical protein
VITSRSQEKLKKVEDEISEYSNTPLSPHITHTHTHTLHSHTHTLTEEKYDHEVVVIPVDFSDGLEIYPNITEQLNDLDIGILGVQLHVEKKSSRIYHYHYHLYSLYSYFQSITLGLDMSILNFSINVQLR